ncbi:hypothetical protein BGX30_005680, partial [Mortierella sp. GBA39]
MSMTLLISLLDGIGMYLIVPLLGMIGLLQMDSGSLPFLAPLTGLIHSWSLQLSLPLVLAVYVLILGGQALLQRSQTLLNARIIQSFIRTLRTETYEGLLRAKWEFYLRKRRSDFNHVMSNELGRVNYGTTLFLQMVTSLIFTVLQIALALWLSPALTVMVLETTELSKHYFAGISDHFGGIKDIKSNRLEASHIHWFRKLTDQMEHNFLEFGRVNSMSQVIYRLSSVVLVAAFMYVAIAVLHTPPEQLITVVLIFTRLWPRFIGIQSNMEQLSSNLPAFHDMRKLQQEYEAEQELISPEAAGASKLALVDGISCTDVSYRYNPKEPLYALRDINVHIPANRMTAIVGKSGAGKSTLRERQLLALRGSIGYVAQDPFLFNESIRYNLQLVDPNAQDDDLWQALEFSASAEFVRKLPQGLDTVIGDRGVRLSGGERQRLVLARAILKRPSILVLDEATSALDSENELLIQQALERLKGSMTMIVIAHRLSTIRNADHVIVMEQGK